MNLPELCEPLFQYICRLNRSARKGVRAEPGQVRAEIKQLFADMRSRAGADRGLSVQYERVELPLMFFVDFMVKECGGALGREWKDLAHERNELAGDEKFFDLLDEELRESGEAAAERLAIYYTCIGLGFTGWYTGQPEHLRKKMMEIAPKIRGLMDSDPNAKVTPEAYEHVNTADLVAPPGQRLVGVGIAVVGLVIVMFAANVTLYFQSRRELRRAVEAIVQEDAPARAAAGEGSRSGQGRPGREGG